MTIWVGQIQHRCRVSVVYIGGQMFFQTLLSILAFFTVSRELWTVIFLHVSGYFKSDVFLSNFEIVEKLKILIRSFKLSTIKN